MTVFDTAIDTLFANGDLAADATYKAGGTGADTTVQVLRTDEGETVSVGNSEFLTNATVLEVRKSQVGSPAIGDTYTIDGTVFVVDNLLGPLDETTQQMSVRKQ